MVVKTVACVAYSSFKPLFPTDTTCKKWPKSTHLFGTVFVVPRIPVGVWAVDMCLRVEAVKPTSSQWIARVSSLHSELLHARSHLSVLGAEVIMTQAFITFSEPPQSLFAEHVACAAAEITLQPCAHITSTINSIVVVIIIIIIIIFIITAWVVALTCYVSHSAKHRKMAHFDPPGSRNSLQILMKHGMVDYVQEPTHMTTLVRVALCGWSGHIHHLSHLLGFFNSFLFFLLLLSSPRDQVSFLDRCGRSIRENAYFRARMCLWGIDNIWLHLWDNIPKKTSPKWAE